jgi:predicted nucleotidyltransferase
MKVVKLRRHSPTLVEMTRFRGISRDLLREISVTSITSIQAPPVAPFSLDALRERLRPFCLRHPVERLEVFGSVARGEASATSDVDLLVTFSPSARFGMFTFLDLKSELETLLGCAVDLLERPAVEGSTNRFKKHYILRSAQTIYERA